MIVGERVPNTGVNFKDNKTGTFGFFTGDSSGKINYYKNLHATYQTMSV
jgi:hypothetical protein